MINRTLLKLCFVFGLGAFSLPVAAEMRVFTCEPELEAMVKELGVDKVSVSGATNSKQDVPSF